MIKKTRFPDQGRVSDKLDDLIKYYGELKEDFPEEDEFQSNRLSRRGIEKTIEIIADTIIDIALILVSSLGLEKPSDSGEAIEILEKHEIIQKPLAEKIKDLISFRNLLVHRYGKIDQHKEYVSIAENHEDIILFVKEIERTLKKFEK